MDKDITSSIIGSLNGIQFGDIFNLEEIQRIQNLFSDATGVASIITHPDGTPISKPSNFCRLCNNIIRKTEKGLANCIKSDSVIGRQNPKGPIIQPCLSGGLWDAGASITVGGKHIANWLIGQVRNEELDEQCMIQYADEIGADRKVFMKALIEVPVMSVEQFNKVSRMLFAFANELSEKAYNNLQLKKQIAEKEKATALLQESEERFRSVTQSANDAIITTNSNGIISGWNRGAENIFGYTEEEITGKELAKIIPLQFIEHNIQDIDRIDQGGGQHFKGKTVELNGLHKNGNEFPIELSLAEWKTSSGKYFTRIIRDITKRKQGEEMLRESIENLRKNNIERDRFFSIIVHDLRSPFNALLGLTQIMAKELPTLTKDEIQKIAISMRNSAIILFRLLENLLEWSRMKQGLIPFNPEIIQLFPIVNESIALVLELAKNKGIEISYNIPHSLKVFADSNILQMVFRNLVSNALKFTPKGGEISLTAKTLGDRSVEISIKDSGVGMSSTIVDNIFKQDIQTNRIGTEGEPSTGLGLIFCKDLIEKHGGKLWVRSVEGKGSVFYFTIPYNAKTEEKTVIKNFESKDKEENQIKNLKILIAEDDETSEIFISMAVKVFDKKVLKVRTGIEAVEVCRNNPDINLVLMDIKMSDMNGYEATRQIRQFNKDVVIIAQTAYALYGDREKAIKAGCNDYISKPINIDLLTSLIKKYIKK